MTKICISETIPKKSADQILTEKADFLYSENKVDELYELLASEKHTYKVDKSLK